MANTGLEQVISSLIKAQSIGVLATYDGSIPYCSLVAFAATGDLKNIVFATMRDTRKYSNLKNSPNISILIDSRTNRIEDFSDAMALTALGAITEPTSGDKASLLDLFMSRHPYLRDFVLDPDCALIRMDVKKYILVTHFKEVSELTIGK